MSAVAKTEKVAKDEDEVKQQEEENKDKVVKGDKEEVASDDIKEEKNDSNYPPNGLSASVQKLPAWIQAGCGNDEYFCEEKGATFLGGKMPDKCPDLSKHGNYMSEVMRENGDIYDKLKDKTTKLGVTLGHCIKTGIDNPGHPQIKTVGMVAGDEESFTVFADLFDPVIKGRHNGYLPDAKHPTDLDVSKLSDTKIDPTGNYVLTSRARTGRSVRGFRLPPTISFEERRKIEQVIVSGLLSLTDELKGDYFPLHGSRSYGAKPKGMSVEKEEELRNAGNLFQEPDSTLLLSGGMGRHWPDSRGIFHNRDKTMFVWLNEEDHMRIISMEKGDNIKRIITRFAKSTQQIQKVLESQGHTFMHNDHLGWILTCPSNLGTGLRAGAMMKIPLFSSRKDFKDIVRRMGLQARGGKGVDSASVGGICDISNKDRIGKSEIQLTNIFIEGAAQIIKWEQALEKGQNIDQQVANIGLPQKY